MGNGITLKVLSGRSVEVRKNLGQKLMEVTKNFLNELNLELKRCEISIDIVEMERETYQKIIIEK